MNKYKVIYADPPWSYRDKALAGERGVHFKYEVMRLADIKALPVQQLADENCAILMWATMPMLGDAIDVMKSWGFKFTTVAFVWVKQNEDGKLAWGMGNWTRSNAELCLLGVKGKPKRMSAGVHQIIREARGKHSAKPGIVRQKIVELFGDVSRVELFAREVTSGWDVWGNEVEGISWQKKHAAD